MEDYEAPRGTLLLMLVFFLLLVLIWSVVFLNLLGREVRP
jgi:hypothetical protein